MEPFGTFRAAVVPDTSPEIRAVSCKQTDGSVSDTDVTGKVTASVALGPNLPMSAVMTEAAGK